MAIEATGARSLPAMILAYHAMATSDDTALVEQLNVVAAVILEMANLLLRMYDHCDPYIFYHRVRIYFSGWSNMESLPNGLLYEGDTGALERFFEAEGLDETLVVDESGGKKYPGGSAAQSCLIHALDVFLGVEHLPTRGASSNPKINFLLEMRKHMPQKHRQFLNTLVSLQSLRDYVIKGAESTSQLKLAYNQCVTNLKLFRDRHIQMVTRYIIIPSKKALSEIDADSPAPPTDKFIANSSNDNAAPRETIGTEDKGTGGTNLVPFLKQSRDETSGRFIK